MKLFSVLALVAVGSGFPLFDRLLWSESTQVDRVIKLGPEEYRLVSEQDKVNLRRQNIKFMDVTNAMDKMQIEEAFNLGLIQSIPKPQTWISTLTGTKMLEEISPPKNYSYPTSIKHQQEVDGLIKHINTTNMYDNLARFTSFYTRYYKTDTGYESAEWLYGQLFDIIAPVQNKVNLTKFRHEWKQFSIIAEIPGKVESKVIVGAHQDSANILLPNVLRSPGADDDGTGTVTILEVFRILIEAYAKGDFEPHHTLEFHWYAAEEGGLLGSFDVFKSFYHSNETVVGLLQQDMTGYTANMKEGDEHVGLISDYTSTHLNEFVKLIIDQYCDIPYHETLCGYACSDHASAIEHGFPASFVIESEFSLTNDYVHTALDTIDRVDFNHVKEHTKLTLGYAYELSLAHVET